MKLLDYLPHYMESEVNTALNNGLEEIRIRIGQQIELLPMKERFGKEITVEKMEEIINYLTDYSIVAYEEQIKKGYFTIDGGYRVGVAGVVNDDGRIDINALNIRIARQFVNCSKSLLAYIKNDNVIYNTLIVSGPGLGKTTYLRDCVRGLSFQYKVGVVDERSEIGAMTSGVLQNDLGPGCDLMGNCGKARGMMMLLRSMSPQIIAVDEIGEEEDYFAINEIMKCGVKFLGTVHAANLEEVRQKKAISNLLQDKLLERIVCLELSKTNQRTFKIYNSDGMQIC